MQSESPLKCRLTALHRSVEAMKKRSQILTQNLSEFSASASLALSPPSPRSRVTTRLACLGSNASPSAVSIATQADPRIPLCDASDHSENFSFSIAERKPDLWPLLGLAEEPSFEVASTAGSSVTPTKRKGGVWPAERSIKRAYTTDGVALSAERRKPTMYFLKVVKVNGKYYDASGVELVLGKPVTQGIVLHGKATTGGFHLFVSAQECMNSEMQCVSPHKDSRIGLMKVSAFGPSLRYFLGSISPREALFPTILPQDVMPMLAATVLLTSAPKPKRSS